MSVGDDGMLHGKRGRHLGWLVGVYGDPSAVANCCAVADGRAQVGGSS